MSHIVVDQAIGYVDGVVLSLTCSNWHSGLVTSQKGSTKCRTMICRVLHKLILSLIIRVVILQVRKHILPAAMTNCQTWNPCTNVYPFHLALLLVQSPSPLQNLDCLAGCVKWYVGLETKRWMSHVSRVLYPLLVYKMVKCCHGASPSEMWSMVSYMVSLLLNGGSTSGGSAAAQICSRLLMLLAGICSWQKMRSVNLNATRFLKGEKSLGFGSSLGGGGALSGRNSPLISQGKP